MINLTDTHIDELADECICDYCRNDVITLLSAQIGKSIKGALEETPKPHKELFDALFKALDPHERKFASMLNAHWEEERKIVVANIKKLKKAYRSKDAEDDAQQVLFPQKEAEKRMANGANPLLINVVEEAGQRELARLEITTAFDVANPEVQKWLKEYVPKFSAKLEAVSIDKLRRELIAGLEAGESIPELIKRVNDTYANWNKVRSYNIAQNQTLRASNRGNLFAYKQSGVVKKKQWVTFHDKRACLSCKRLDGKIIGLEENYFNEGDKPEVIEEDGKKHTFNNDYEDISAPPRHTRCRCSIAPVVG